MHFNLIVSGSGRDDYIVQNENDVLCLVFSGNDVLSNVIGFEKCVVSFHTFWDCGTALCHSDWKWVVCLVRFIDWKWVVCPFRFIDCE